jgi:uncharacterized damage-inducible protein DinB
MPYPDEREALMDSLALQRAALRNAVHGLTEEQAAAKPSASELSLGGLVKHAARSEQGWIHVRVGGRPNPFADGRDWVTEFRIEPGETLAGWLAELDSVARESAEVVAALPSLDTEIELPSAPWFPDGRVSARWVLLHMIEETARHVGHADIIRESLDGATAGELAKAVRG